MPSFIQQWLRPDLLKMAAYQVEKTPYAIKLDAMESPYRPDRAQQAQLKKLATADINRYPDSHNTALKQTLKQLMAIPEELSLLLGNGSDELIQLLAMACAKNATIAGFTPSFVMYEIIAKLTQLNYLKLTLNPNFDIDLNTTLKQLNKTPAQLIFIAYPNNPTANLFNRQAIKEIINQSNALVIIDEAYYAYTNDSFIADIKQHQNLLVLRTLSKIGFAGLRLGLLIGSPEIITQLEKLRMPYNINTLTQTACAHILTPNSITKNTQRIIEQRDYLIKQLGTITALTVYPSQTNFIVIKCKQADDLFLFLKNKGIIIKSLKTQTLLNNCLRITVGTQTENKHLIDTIKHYYD